MPDNDTDTSEEGNIWSEIGMQQQLSQRLRKKDLKYCPHPKQAYILFPQIRFCQHLGGVQPRHLPSFTTNLLMLIPILQKILQFCRLARYYCIIDTLSRKCCIREYGFCVEFVTCVQDALNSHGGPKCSDGMEFEN